MFTLDELDEDPEKRKQFIEWFMNDGFPQAQQERLDLEEAIKKEVFESQGKKAPAERVKYIADQIGRRTLQSKTTWGAFTPAPSLSFGAKPLSGL